MTNLEEKRAEEYLRLKTAVRNIYYAGLWSCDRPVDEVALWTELRDAAGFPQGHSPKPLGCTPVEKTPALTPKQLEELIEKGEVTDFSEAPSHMRDFMKPYRPQLQEDIHDNRTLG